MLPAEILNSSQASPFRVRRSVLVDPDLPSVLYQPSGKAKMEKNFWSDGVGAVVHPVVEESASADVAQQVPKDKEKDLQKELQMCMTAINAILVGAAVIVGITFQGFLTPPYTNPANPTFALDFCIYNSFSFYSAVSTVIVGAGATLPPLNSRIALVLEEEVQSVRRWVTCCSLLLAMSIVGVLGAVPGPDYGSPPDLKRHVAISVIHCMGLFMCALAMTAYVLRLNWNLVGKLDRQVSRQERAQIALPTNRPGTKKNPSLRRALCLVGLCGLIFSFFLAFLFFLPFYAKFYG